MQTSTFIVTILFFLHLFLTPCTAETVTVDLNGLEIGIDDVTGGIVSMTHPTVGDIINTTSQESGLVDVAYPIEAFGPMRRATRFSKAQITQKKDEIIITWDNLGPSKTFYEMPEGKVSAQVSLKAAPNGKSVILTCKIENHTQVPVRQVIFPDIFGLRPFTGTDKTKIHIANRVETPFAGPVRHPHTASFYAKGIGWTTYEDSKDLVNDFDKVYLFGPNTGVSIYHKGKDQAADRIFTDRQEVSPEHLRLLYEHQDNIEPGQTWKSDEYWITPYQGSKTNGIPSVRKIQLNGLDIMVDEDTGNLVRLYHPQTDTLLLDCEEGTPAMVEAGIGKSQYVTPTNYSSQYAKVKLESVDGGIDLIWDELTPIKPDTPAMEGKIAARVSIRAAEDHKSVLMSCTIENNTGQQIHLIKFPDLAGFRPIESVDRTRVRLSRDLYKPFKLWGQEENVNILTWVDYGGYNSGLSIYQEKWNRSFEDMRPNIMTFRDQSSPDQVRLTFGHKTTKRRLLVDAGQTWESGRFCLMPHAGGWAKGIEPFRKFVDQHRYHRQIPKHIHENIGFMTIWMIQNADNDPAAAAFRYTDLPDVAANAKEHGLHEIVPWFWRKPLEVPLITRPVLGTEEEFIQGILTARDMGVNIAPFISVNIMKDELAEKYGSKPGTARWTYHQDLIPNFRAYYSDFNTGTRLGGGSARIDPLWLSDVEDTLMDWIDKGVTSFCWDLWYTHPELLDMMKKVRAKASAAYAESTFPGEAHSLEQDDEVLDYTWNWSNYHDNTPITTVLPYPRLNCNVESSALIAKMFFCDNIFMNVMPRKPDQPNGTSLIIEGSELSDALKECAKLRRQFLDYFVNGTLIGDSILSTPTSGYVRGYQLNDSVLIFVLNNNSKAQKIDFSSNLALWLPKSKTYQMKYYNAQGKVLNTFDIKQLRWSHTTDKLEPNELSIFEVTSQK